MLIARCITLSITVTRFDASEIASLSIVGVGIHGASGDAIESIEAGGIGIVGIIEDRLGCSEASHGQLGHRRILTAMGITPIPIITLVASKPIENGFYGRLSFCLSGATGTQIHGHRHEVAAISVRNGGKFFAKRLVANRWLNRNRPYLLALENPLDPEHDVGANSYNILSVRRAMTWHAR